jgi:hypothetical protein
MASLACGRRLSLRNQYDTKTPRARVFFCCARQTDGAVIRAIRRPSCEKPGHARVTKKNCSVGFEMSVENFFRKKNSKNSLRDPEALPDYCCCMCCKTAARSFLNVALGQEGRKPS